MSLAPRYQFLLYVVGDAPNSLKAIANLQALCCEHLPDRHEIEIVDVASEPDRAMKDGVMLTPTLVKLSPKPVRQIIGNLSNIPIILQTIGL